MSSMNGWTKKHSYLNALSRLEKFESKIKQDIIVVLSGPEPARTKLEQQLINIFNLTKGTNFYFILIIILII